MNHEFLYVKSGDLVAVKLSHSKKTDWYVAQVLNPVGSSLDPKVNTLFQVIDVDTGKVTVINADLVIGIIKTNH